MFHFFNLPQPFRPNEVVLRGPCVRKLYYWVNMSYPLKIKNIALCGIVLTRVNGTDLSRLSAVCTWKSKIYLQLYGTATEPYQFIKNLKMAPANESNEMMNKSYPNFTWNFRWDFEYNKNTPTTDLNCHNEYMHSVTYKVFICCYRTVNGSAPLTFKML